MEKAEEVWQQTFSEMRARFGLPVPAHGDEQAERTRRRLRHLLATDPGGSWVASDDEGVVVGLSQGLRRGGLWVLSMLGVAVRAQGAGVGRRLLAHAVDYGAQADAGLIMSSRDPRAMCSYVAAGFALHPVVAGVGQVVKDRLPPVSGVRAGSTDDLGLAGSIDERVRGASHGPDFRHLLDSGVEMLVVDERGYALVRGSQPVIVAATDPDAARRLLVATLAGGPPGQHVEVGWLGGGQQWAISVVVAAGLRLEPAGAILVRGRDAPPAPYLANGAFG